MAVEGMEEKLGAILNDPNMMQQIMSMAQSLGSSTSPKQSEEKKPGQTIDAAALQKLSGIAGNCGVDQQQKLLLQALSPYLNRDRITKLENAMRAAKIAKLASSFLGNGGLQNLIGR